MIKQKPKPTKLVDKRIYDFNSEKSPIGSPRKLKTTSKKLENQDNLKDIEDYKADKTNIINEQIKHSNGEINNKIDSEYNPWSNEINFIQDTGNIKDFLDFCQYNSIFNFQENKKGLFLNDIKYKNMSINKLNSNLEKNFKENNKSKENKHEIHDVYINIESSKRKEHKEENNFICNYYSNEPTEYNDIDPANKKNTLNYQSQANNKAENFLKAYEKYQVKEKKDNQIINDNKDLICDELKSHKINNIKNNNFDNANKILEKENSKEEVNNLLYGRSCFIDILEKLNNLSLNQFKVIIFIYQKKIIYNFIN